VDKLDHHDQLLIRYLLGALPNEEAQRLDELSIADDEFALRLRVAEDDLVDSYARGELSGETLRQFEAFYLSSPKRLQKLAFAETMRARELRTADATVTAPSVQTAAVFRSLEKRENPKPHSPWRIFSVPRLSLQWGFAAAAMSMAVIAGFLFLEVGQLRRQIAGTEYKRVAVDQREQTLEKQLSEQRTANAQTQNEIERLRSEASHFNTMKSIAVLLMPQTRGSAQPVSVSVPAGIDAVPVRLALESNEFPEYQVTLKEPGSDRALWRSARLKTEAQGKNKSLSLSIPANLLKQQTYALEASGLPAKGAPEFLSGYVFRVVFD
jgi:hypothetical protein